MSLLHKQNVTHSLPKIAYYNNETVKFFRKLAKSRGQPPRPPNVTYLFCVNRPPPSCVFVEPFQQFVDLCDDL